MLGLREHVLSQQLSAIFSRSVSKQSTIQTLDCRAVRDFTQVMFWAKKQRRVHLYPLKDVRDNSNSQPPSFDWALCFSTTLIVASITRIGRRALTDDTP